MQENQEKVVNPMEEDYLNTINEMKKNSVSRADYDTLREENRKLLQSIVDGSNVETVEAVPVRTVKEIREELFDGKEKSNLEFCKLSLELRDRVLETEGKDIFVAENSQYHAGADSYEAAARVASVMSECIDYANGDSEAFTNELMRRTNDVQLPRR